MSPQRDRHPHSTRRAGWLLPGAILALALGVTGRPAAGPDRALPATLDARLTAALQSEFAAARAGLQSPDEIIPCIIEGPVPAGRLVALDVGTGARFGDKITARVPRSRLLEVARLPGVRAVRAARRLEPQLDLSGMDDRATLVHQGAPDTALGVLGDSVLIGVIDTGLDVYHPDFRWSNGSTRVAALWDQNDPLGPPPAGFSYGSGWNAAQIDLGLCRERDSTYYGHGTHVAGVAGGSGRATGNSRPAFTFVGVAPHSRLAIVSSTFDDVDILDGIDWIFQQATLLGLPAVVNLSLGGANGPHDGTTDLELAIAAMSGPGRIVVASAGNSNGRGSHAECVVAPSGTTSVTFRIFGYTPSPTVSEGLFIDAWYNTGDDLPVTVRTPNGTLVGPVAKGALVTQNTADGRVSVNHGGVESRNANNDVEVLIEISDSGGAAVTAGDWEIQLTRVTAPSGGEVDFWISDSSFPYPPAFMLGREEAELVLAPATGDSVIGVAAHTTRTSWTALNGSVYNYGQTLNQIGNFSSVGPRRDNQPKPDLSAPGTAIGSSHSSLSAPNPAPNILPDGVHKILQGTSMSAPQVAGAVALMLSRWKQLSCAQARQALTSTARTDAFTGAVPNATWGHGKLDLERLFANRLAFAAQIDPPRIINPGGVITLHNLCARPGSGTWGTRYRARVSDSRGWLHHSTGGPSVPVASWSGVSAWTTFDGAACAPFGGWLTIEPPAATPTGTVTTVTFEVEPDGLPWMRQTLTTTVTVSALAEAAGPDWPDRLGLTVHSGAGGPGFELALPRAGRVAVDLFDAAGRRVGSVLDAEQPAGRSVIEWDSAGREPLARGIYFVRADDGREQVTRRLIVTR